MRKVFVLIVTGILLFLNGCVQISPLKQPYAKKGIIDLRSWDFKSDRIVSLDGEWEFYWQKLLTPEDFQTNKTLICNDYIRIPGTWDRFVASGTNLSGRGFCTIRLLVKLPDTNNILGFETGEIGTAYYLWLDGLRKFASGVVGPSEGRMLEKISYKPIYFKPSQKDLEVVIQISNFKDRHGGVWGSILFGSESGLSFHDLEKTAIEMLLTGILLITGIYQLILFIFNRKDLSFLFFGIFCLLIGLRTVLTSGWLFEFIFKNIGFEWYDKMQLLIIDIAPPVFLFFLRSLFPKEADLRIVSALSLPGILLALFVLPTPVKIHTNALTVSQYVLTFLIPYVFFVLFRALRKKREGSVLVLSGFAVLAAVIMNDILYSNLVINSSMIIPVGMMIFILLQSVMLSIRVARLQRNPALSMEIGVDKIESFCEKYSISPREKEVMLLLIKGMQYLKISEMLFISVSTLKKHVNSLYTKTGAGNKLELTHLLVRENKI